MLDKRELRRVISKVFATAAQRKHNVRENQLINSSRKSSKT